MMRVLVVDDDAAVLEYIERTLEPEALQLMVASHPVDALARLKTDRVDLLLTDVRMPTINGFELARMARTLQPDIRVLFLSGYTRELSLDPARDAYLAKPFRPHELIGCIYEVLSRNEEKARVSFR